MEYKQRDNAGTLFVNAQKTSDKHPHRKGTALIEGEEWEMAGWIRTDRDGNVIHDKNGNPMLNMKFSRKSDRSEAKPAPVEPMVADEDIPF